MSESQGHEHSVLVSGARHPEEGGLPQTLTSYSWMVIFLDKERIKIIGLAGSKTGQKAVEDIPKARDSEKSVKRA